MNSDTTPLLTVVVIIATDTTQRADVGQLRQCLAALAVQRNPPAMEIIVPHHAGLREAESLVASFPDVIFLPVDIAVVKGNREHHDLLRACGMVAARGELIALTEDHLRPDSNWCANMYAAHREAECAAIGGAIENGIDRPLNWAVYYCDYGRYQNPLPAGESECASDVNTSYKRTALDKIREIWSHSFREPIVNGALWEHGEKVMLRPDIVVYQHRENLRLGSALRERFIWGRSFAVTRIQLLGRGKRFVYAALVPVLPALLMWRIARTAWKRRRRHMKFIHSMPLIALLLCSWSAGESVGYLTGKLSQGVTST